MSKSHNAYRKNIERKKERSIKNFNVLFRRKYLVRTKKFVKQTLHLK